MTACRTATYTDRMNRGEAEEEGVGLLVHMGGLGDVCLSESTILSVARHLGGRFHAVGNRSVLEPFGEYFTAVDSIDGRKWTHLFADGPSGQPLDQVVFIGKDRTGAFRRRLAAAAGEVIFIDMYPDGKPVHVEGYQLGQLAAYGIPAVKKERRVKSAKRVVVYAEKAYKKKKWPVEGFVEVFERLEAQGIPATSHGAAGLTPARRSARPCLRAAFRYRGFPLAGRRFPFERLRASPFCRPVRHVPGYAVLRYGP